jgi:hypothetical protein
MHDMLRWASWRVRAVLALATGVLLVFVLPASG